MTDGFEATDGQWPGWRFNVSPEPTADEMDALVASIVLAIARLPESGAESNRATRWTEVGRLEALAYAADDAW